MINVIRKVLSEALTAAYTNANNLYQRKLQDYHNRLNNTGIVEYDYSDPQFYIKLTVGKFRGAIVPKQLIVDLTTAAKKAGLDPYVLLGMVGQESTFGNGNQESQLRRASKASLISGWNLKQGYKPYDLNRFLADNRVPGISQFKTTHGIDFQVQDEAKVNQYLDANPRIIQNYLQKLNATPQIPSDFDDFYQAAIWVKKKGVGSYNAGDKGYAAAVNNSASLLRKDPALTAFLRNPVIPPRPQFKPGRESRGRRRV